MAPWGDATRQGMDGVSVPQLMSIPPPTSHSPDTKAGMSIRTPPHTDRPGGHRRLRYQHTAPADKRAARADRHRRYTQRVAEQQTAERRKIRQKQRRLEQQLWFDVEEPLVLKLGTGRAIGQSRIHQESVRGMRRSGEKQTVRHTPVRPGQSLSGAGDGPATASRGTPGKAGASGSFTERGLKSYSTAPAHGAVGQRGGGLHASSTASLATRHLALSHRSHRPVVVAAADVSQSAQQSAAEAGEGVVRGDMGQLHARSTLLRHQLQNMGRLQRHQRLKQHKTAPHRSSALLRQSGQQVFQ